MACSINGTCYTGDDLFAEENRTPTQKGASGSAEKGTTLINTGTSGESDTMGLTVLACVASLEYKLFQVSIGFHSMSV